jgi:bacterioferritin-associated ferredoxin
MRIDRCLCFGRTFSELKDIADRTGAHSIAGLQAHVQFGQNCRLCHPYVRRMLTTGETVFHRVMTEEDRDGQG